MLAYTKINGKYYIVDADTKSLIDRYSGMPFDSLSRVMNFIKKLNDLEVEKIEREQVKKPALSDIQKYRQ